LNSYKKTTRGGMLIYAIQNTSTDCYFCCLVNIYTLTHIADITHDNDNSQLSSSRYPPYKNIHLDNCSRRFFGILDPPICGCQSMCVP